MVAVNTMVMACGSQGTTQNPKNPGMEPTPTESGHYRNLVFQDWDRVTAAMGPLRGFTELAQACTLALDPCALKHFSVNFSN